MKVIIVEDDAVVAETVSLYLEQAGHEVVVARDGVTGLALASAPEAAAVILDLMIPGLSGLEVCRRLRAVSTVPILMRTARVSEDDRLAGFEAGADDYVGKPFAPREIVARVQALLRRSASSSLSVPPPPLTIGGLEIDLWARQVRVHNRTVPVTATEFRILAALAAAPGRIFSREELLARVFGPDYEGLDRTVDVHVTNLRRKIEVSGQPRCILTAHGLGYRLATDV